MNGHPSALGELLERHRPWLRTVAEMRVGRGLAARIDPSDVVQLTCVDVVKQFSRFRGHSIEHFLAWLRRVHDGQCARAIRDQLRECRDPRREAAPALEVSGGSSPSHRAMQNERAVGLSEALERLPDRQRRAVVLRFFELEPIDEIADRLETTPAAVVGLVRRGILALRSDIPPDEVPR